MSERGSGFFAALFVRSNVTRAMRVAAVVGPTLIILNHFDCWQRQALGRTCLWQSLATLFVPFAVSAYSGAANAIASKRGGSSP